MTWQATMVGSITGGGFLKYLRLTNVAQVLIRQSIPGRDIGHGLNRSNEIGRITKVRCCRPHKKTLLHFFAVLVSDSSHNAVLKISELKNMQQAERNLMVVTFTYF